MQDYYIRCRSSQLTELKRYLDKIGAIEFKKGVVTANDNDVWDEIGSVSKPLEAGDPEGTIKGMKGGDVDPWYFINFRTKINLKRRMDNRVEADPTLLDRFDATLADLRVRKVDGESEEITELERVFL